MKLISGLYTFFLGLTFLCCPLVYTVVAYNDLHAPRLAKEFIQSPLGSKIFHPEVSLDAANKLLDERNAYWRAHGAPDGQGMIFAPRSKIAVLGNFDGYYDSFQRLMMRLYKKGIIDEQLHVKPHCYIVALGGYTGEGGQGVAILSTLLTLQALNPNQVFLLRGDQEDVAKAQINGFKKEWYGAYAKTQKDFCMAELVWLKLLMLWKSLPKVLMAGLQMPSTQHYKFLMFCNGMCEYNWRPDDFMGRVVEKHIDQLYKYPCALEYRNDNNNDAEFVQGTFADEADIAKVRAKNISTHNHEPVWTLAAFEDFIERHGVHKDKKRMYECCLCALVRGRDRIPGGIVVAKRGNAGHMYWRPLKEEKIYEMGPCSVYTCTSGAQSMSKSGCFDGAFGIIEAGINGNWYITSYLEE